MPKNFLETVVGEAERQAQYKRVEQVVASGSVEHDLRQALEASDKPRLTVAAYSYHEWFIRNGRTPMSQYHSHWTTALSTLSCFRIGKTRLFTNPMKMPASYH